VLNAVDQATPKKLPRRRQPLEMETHRAGWLDLKVWRDERG
jgi:hypothetical protein